MDILNQNASRRHHRTIICALAIFNQRLKAGNIWTHTMKLSFTSPARSYIQFAHIKRSLNNINKNTNIFSFWKSQIRAIIEHSVWRNSIYMDIQMYVSTFMSEWKGNCIGRSRLSIVVDHCLYKLYVRTYMLMLPYIEHK